MQYEAVIGLEVHAELSTKSKIFCACSAAFGGEINSHACPICMGMPGTLPVLNKEVIAYGVKMALATHSRVNQLCKSDRKNYFYPDLPKAYQISQFDVPLCEEGRVDFYVEGEKKSVRLTRIHFEEDAGKLLHENNGTVIDYNRCGVPLLEMVTEPDIRSAKEAKEFLEMIKTILSYLAICDCKMEEGSIRCDVNVSLRPFGQAEYGTRVEMKNVNTFSGAVRAIEYETKRQADILNKGGTVQQETRRWDDVLGENVVLRSKEDAHDYRYFPDPDLVAVEISEDWLRALEKTLPQLPIDRYERYLKVYEISELEARSMMENKAQADFFDEAVGIGTVSPKAVVNWLLSDVAKYLNDKNLTLGDTSLTPARLAEMISLIDQGEISSSAAKKVLLALFETEEAATDLVVKLGLKQVSDTGAILVIVQEVLTANPKSIADYQSGKTNALGFLVGQCMKASKGKANPQVIHQLLEEALLGL